MKHCFMFLLGIFLSATLYGQNYSSEVVFLQQQGNTLTVRALGLSEKKKEAANIGHEVWHSIPYSIPGGGWSQ